MARWLARRSGDAAPATAPGRLVALPSSEGWYPALVPGPANLRCRGTLLQVKLGAGDLTRLDRYEGAEYRRAVRRVHTTAGSRSAGVYLWRHAIPNDAVPIVGGDFLDWLQRTGRSAFATRRDGA